MAFYIVLLGFTGVSQTPIGNCFVRWSTYLANSSCAFNGCDFAVPVMLRVGLGRTHMVLTGQFWTWVPADQMDQLKNPAEALPCPFGGWWVC